VKVWNQVVASGRSGDADPVDEAVQQIGRPTNHDPSDEEALECRGDCLDFVRFHLARGLAFPELEE
jgi:hypothetical protein